MEKGIIWSAIYNDGTVLTERTHRYIDIERRRLAAFEIGGPMGLLHRQEVDTEHSGSQLVWRRRNGMSTKDNRWLVWHVVGWTNGPVWAIDLDKMEKIMAPRFGVGHPIFYPPQPIEGEVFEVTQNGLQVIRNRFKV